MDGFRHGGLRVPRLTGGHADEFGAGEREVDGQNRGEHRHEAVGEDAVLDEIAEHRSMLVAGDRNNAEYGEQADDDERADSEHLDGGEPELRLGEETHRQGVQGEDECDARRAPRPCGTVREPALHEQPGGGELGSERHRPCEPVLNRDHEAGTRADELLGIHMEGTGHRHGHGQFAEREHDQVDDQRADAIRQNGADGARLLDGVSGAQEQAGADHAAQRDHLQVARLHAALQVRVQSVFIVLASRLS